MWRPIRAASSIFLVAALTAQRAHVLLRSRIVFPHPGQMFSLRGVDAGGKNGLRFLLHAYWPESAACRVERPVCMALTRTHERPILPLAQRPDAKLLQFPKAGQRTLPLGGNYRRALRRTIHDSTAAA